MIQVRGLAAWIVVHLALGAFEPTDEVVEVRMRTARDATPALRLTLHEGDLHGIRPDSGRDR
ncbi:hypothetical protein ACVWYH_007553 [Bradyrhizobium sp. GM24.11]